MRDGNVLESDVEFLGALEQLGAYAVRDSLTLGDELGSVELGDDGLQDFVANGGENTLVVVCAKVLLRQLVNHESKSVKKWVVIEPGTGKYSIFRKASYLVDPGQHPNFGPVQHSERQAHHLQVLAASCGRNVPRLRAHIIDDRPLHPGDQEMCSLIDDRLFHTLESVEDDSASATADVVDGSLADREGDETGNGPLVGALQQCLHDCGY